MYYVYVLLSFKDYKLYIGFTKNLKNRFNLHQTGQVKATKGRLPVKLIFYEAYVEKEDALRREKYFKTNPGKWALKLMLKTCFKNSLRQLGYEVKRPSKSRVVPLNSRILHTRIANPEFSQR